VAKAQWKGLCRIFSEVRGFELSRFESYETLHLLHDVASAVRHGNGRATEALFNAHPELFNHEPINSWFAYFALGGEPKHSIYRLDIPLELLRRFGESIADFWLTVRALQISGAPSEQ
jgi:hypothetical protein